MKPLIRHPMQYVARQTGLKPYLIRTWEERYKAVCPRRSETNRRLYSDEDVARLVLLKRTVDSGHTISSVAPLSDEELRALVAPLGAQPPGPGAASERLTPQAGRAAEDAANRVAAALEATLRLDAGGLERVLTKAAVEMTRQAFLQDMIVPLFAQIGSLWQAGDLKIVNEHLASVTVRAILWDMMRSIDVADTAPRILVATPVGHWHEIGALAAALAAAESGWRACYCGPNLPSDEIAYAALRLEARAVCLSLCHRLDDRHLPVEITNLRRSVGHQMPLFVGGSGTETVVGLTKKLKIEIITDLGAFRDRLDKILGGG